MASRPAKPALVSSRGNPLAPTPRAQPHLDALKSDGWSNVVTGLGDPNRDKRLQASFTTDYFTQVELEEIYRGNDLAATIVDTVPEEMCRTGFSVTGDDKDGCEALAAAAGQGNSIQVEKRLDVLGKFKEALKHKRAYGGGALLLGVDDGQEPIMPLDESRIQSFDWITELTAEECQPAARYQDPLHPKYGEPSHYRVVPMVAPAASMIVGANANLPNYMTVVHESRVVSFPGVAVSRRQLAKSYNFGWGDSVLSRCWRVIRDFDTSWDGAAHLLQDFAQGVLKLKGLYESVMSEDPNTQNGLVNRMLALDYTRSLLRMMAIDSEEDFERKPTPLSGLPELLDRFCNRLSAAARIPVTILMGQAPAGLQATGDSDIRKFYDSVEAERETVMRPRLERVLRLLMLAKDGPTAGKLIDGWSVQFPALWELTDLETAQVRLAHAQADQIEIQEGVVTPEEVAMSRHGGDQWSAHTSLDKDLREKLAAAPEVSEDGDPVADPALADPNSVNPKAALMGPQVAAMLEIVRAVAAGEIPRAAGVAMIAQSFPVSEAEADKIVGDAGRGFMPKVMPGTAGPAGAAPAPAGGAPEKPGPVEVTAHERAGAPVTSHTRAAPGEQEPPAGGEHQQEKPPAPASGEKPPAKTDSAGNRKPRRGKR